ncbi:NUDIX domain-containing protein [Asanoa sp. NPDC049518]|uniref:NUDIX domain-containing protein n=1 Tax=unclassified Asanoa TaxID=2685164 RepID=UPI0034204B06
MTTADPVEAEHRADTLAWLAGTTDVYRRIKPDTPPRHLVSYVVPVDPHDGSVLLVDHVNAGLWLPPGGHVEPGEDPAETARREAFEELGIEVVVDEPLFLTVTTTVGIDRGHTDVSLWYPVAVDKRQRLVADDREFNAARWWSAQELRNADPGRFDPHFGRFLRKLRLS